MNSTNILQDRILNVTEENFQELALEVFDYQSKHNKVYAEYLSFLKKSHFRPESIDEIPFLPTSIFKNRVIKSGDWKEKIIFESSGTTSEIKSKHYVRSLDWYHQVSQKCFEHHYGSLTRFHFVCLLPGIESAPFSSLVSMYQNFVKESSSFGEETCYLHSPDGLLDRLDYLSQLQRTIILFGLSFALLDFVESRTSNISNLIVIETGGMKNMRRQIDRLSLINRLQSGFPRARIHSEYGMTELMTQAYSLDGINYSTSPLSRIIITDPSDPFQILPANKRGIVNVLDLANLHTCSFLQTGDLGIINDKSQFQILGRYQAEDLRGCVQLYE